METNSNRQNQALAILTIGTVALGVVLYQVDFQLANALSDLRSQVPLGIWEALAIVKLIEGGIVIVNYFAMFGSVVRILRQTEYVTGRQLAEGPLLYLWIEMWFLVLVFIIDVIQGWTASNK
jgi:hypothetical protein